MTTEEYHEIYRYTQLKFSDMFYKNEYEYFKGFIGLELRTACKELGYDFYDMLMYFRYLMYNPIIDEFEPYIETTDSELEAFERVFKNLMRSYKIEKLLLV